MADPDYALLMAVILVLNVL